MRSAAERRLDELDTQPVDRTEVGFSGDPRLRRCRVDARLLTCRLLEEALPGPGAVADRPELVRVAVAPPHVDLAAFEDLAPHPEESDEVARVFRVIPGPEPFELGVRVARERVPAFRRQEQLSVCPD